MKTTTLDQPRALESEQADPPTPEDMFLANLHLINQVTRHIARRHYLPHGEADDFRSTVYLRLIDDDYSILRNFQRRSSLRTFLVVVINRLYLDFRASVGGKFRPSAEAKRRGPTALALERLLVRDRLTFEEAAGVLDSRTQGEVSRRLLESLAARLPARSPRRLVGEELLAEVPDRAPLPEATVTRRELRARLTRVLQTIESVLARCEPLDRQMIDLHFRCGLGIAQIARLLRIDARPLYRRLDSLLKRLRNALEADPPIAGMAQDLLTESRTEPGDWDSLSA